MGVTRMNEECLKLKDHTAGYQTVQDIQRVVTEAIGGRAALSNEQLIDEVMVRLLPCSVNLASPCVQLFLLRCCLSIAVPLHAEASPPYTCSVSCLTADACMPQTAVTAEESDGPSPSMPLGSPSAGWLMRNVSDLHMHFLQEEDAYY